jgi:hypothetical protein
MRALMLGSYILYARLDSYIYYMRALFCVSRCWEPQALRWLDADRVIARTCEVSLGGEIAVGQGQDKKQIIHKALIHALTVSGRSVIHAIDFWCRDSASRVASLTVWGVLCGVLCQEFFELFSCYFPSIARCLVSEVHL